MRPHVLRFAQRCFVTLSNKHMVWETHLLKRSTKECYSGDLSLLKKKKTNHPPVISDPEVLMGKMTKINS